MEIVLSGMRPTGKLHLGNYYGAAVNFVKMQHDYNCFFMIADYHALTTHTRPETLEVSVREVLVDYLACGLDPTKCSIYIQSHVQEVAELYLLLNMFAYNGELEKTTTFKEKIKKKGQTINAGLLTYPVLMAADILLHRALKVPVGKDQEQHIEMTRNFAKRFNNYYGVDFLPEPVGFNYGGKLVKVPGLDGGTKMSKSDNERTAIFLRDTDEEIIKKMKKAKTDSGPTEANQEKPQEVKNLFALMDLVSSDDTIKHFEDAYNNCNIRYGELKLQLADDMIKHVTPIRQRINDLEADRGYLKKVAKEGAEKAKESANQTLQGMREIMGLNNLYS